MKERKHRALILLLCFLICVSAVLLIMHLVTRSAMETVISEYTAHWDAAFSDIFDQPDCIEYGLTDIRYEIEDCVPTHSVSGKWYVLTLRIDCTSDMDLDNTEKSLLAYEVMDQIPEEFRTSKGHRVSVRNKDSGSPYAASMMVYICVNDQLIRSPEALKSGNASAGDVICPKCGTGWRAGSVAAKYVKENGICSVCN